MFPSAQNNALKKLKESRCLMLLESLTPDDQKLILCRKQRSESKKSLLPEIHDLKCF